LRTIAAERYIAQQAQREQFVAEAVIRELAHSKPTTEINSVKAHFSADTDCGDFLKRP
jgi:hypothetical protein